MGLGIKEKIDFMNTLIKLSAAGYDKKDVDRYLEMLETSPSVIDGAATVTEENVEKIKQAEVAEPEKKVEQPKAETNHEEVFDKLFE